MCGVIRYVGRREAVARLLPPDGAGSGQGPPARDPRALACHRLHPGHRRPAVHRDRGEAMSALAVAAPAHDELAAAVAAPEATASSCASGPHLPADPRPQRGGGDRRSDGVRRGPDHAARPPHRHQRQQHRRTLVLARSRPGWEVWETVGNTGKKGGALNQAWDRLEPRPDRRRLRRDHGRRHAPRRSTSSSAPTRSTSSSRARAAGSGASARTSPGCRSTAPWARCR